MIEHFPKGSCHSRPTCLFANIHLSISHISLSSKSDPHIPIDRVQGLIHKQTSSPAIKQIHIKRLPHHSKTNARKIDPLRRANSHPVRDIFVSEVEWIVVKKRQKVDKHYAKTHERDLDHGD